MHLVAFEGSSEGETDAGVAGGRLDEMVAFFYTAGIFGFDDHTSTDTVFDGTTGVEELTFEKDFAFKTWRKKMKGYYFGRKGGRRGLRMRMK